jgi:hypothetical protein
MQDLIASILSMQMDVYRQRETQDEYTGAMKREWMYYKTIDCHAKGIISNSATTRSSDKQIFDNRYINDQVIQVRTLDRITAKEKITNIRNSEGDYIWTEQNFPEETPTVFEVIGTTPITDPFGRTIGYNSALKRSENQGIGI